MQCSLPLAGGRELFFERPLGLCRLLSLLFAGLNFG
jgi:hypothetical protein